jgi:cytochrome b6-f complex iron-sulfur subunit
MALNPYESSQGRLRTRLETTRRQFLYIMGGLAALGAVVFGGFETLNFLFPAATNDAPAKFKTNVTSPPVTFDSLTGGVQGGRAKNAPSVVSITADRVSIVLDDAGIYAVLLICTHLGCTPNYVTDVTTGTGLDTAAGNVTQHYVNEAGHTTFNGWACPCHGSRYFIDSTNFYGPAPRPMDWVSIEVSPDGFFVIDRSNIVAYRQPGDTTPPAWRLDVTTKQSNGKTLGV